MKPFPPGMDRAPPPISDSVSVAVVAASTAENIAVPTGARLAVLTASALAYCRADATAAIAAADVSDGTGSTPLPAGVSRAFNVEGVANISVISATASALVTAEFYGSQ